MGRGNLIAGAPSEVRAAEEERVAAEGYRFYAQEASEFAEASAGAVAEALDYASQDGASWRGSLVQLGIQVEGRSGGNGR